MNNLQAKCPKCGFSYMIPLKRELIRTIPQNKLYWGVYIKILSEELGYTSEEMHEELKYKFNPKDSKLTPGARVGGSTRAMTRKEFTRYLENINIWAQDDLGVSLPEVTGSYRKEAKNEQ